MNLILCTLRKGRSLRYYAWALLFCLLLTGCMRSCQKKDTSVKEQGDMGNVPASAQKANEAAEKQDAAEKERLSKLKGYNQNIGKANESNADPKSKAAIGREVTGQESLLSDVQADKKVVEEGNKRLEASRNGDEAKADKLLADALQDNKAYLIKINEINQQAAKEREALQESVRLKAEELQRNKEENQRKVDALVKDFQRQIDEMNVSFAIKCAVGLGSLFVLLGVGGFVLCVYTGIGLKPRNILACAALLAFGVSCFVTAPFLAHKWIPYAVGGVILLGAFAVGIYFFIEMRKHMNEKNEHAETKDVLQEEYNLMRKTFAHVVDRLEEAPEEKTKEIFSALKGDMDVAMRKLVAEIKAERPSKQLGSP